MKQKRYWLRGVLLFGILGVLASVRFAFGLAHFSCGFSGGCTGDFNRLLTFLRPEYFYQAFSIVLPISLIAGLLVGWLYEKIKNRNKVKQVV